MTIEQICTKLQIKGKYLRCEPLGNGIINNSYKVTYEDEGKKIDYLVQKINSVVFKRPDRIMQNIVGVTDYVREKIIKEGKDPARYVLNFAKTKEGLSYVFDNNEYWRAYLFIKDSTTYNETDDPVIIEQTGKAFGDFQVYLIDYDASKLYVSIPNFHNTERRYENFKEAVMLDAYDRVQFVGEEIEKLYKWEIFAKSLAKKARKGEIEVRVTHNDTKSNNVVFAKEKKEALAVIDLDTVMPGLVAYDFGDCARFICSNAKEDETELNKVSFNLTKFESLTKGFVGEVGHFLSEAEIESLAVGVYAMTVELAVRFLTDYLSGDVYFKTNYPGHNLDRARCQIKLAEDIYAKLPEIDRIVRKYL